MDCEEVGVGCAEAIEVITAANRRQTAADSFGFIGRFSNDLAHEPNRSCVSVGDTVDFGGMIPMTGMNFYNVQRLRTVLCHLGFFHVEILRGNYYFKI